MDVEKLFECLDIVVTIKIIITYALVFRQGINRFAITLRIQ